MPSAVTWSRMEGMREHTLVRRASLRRWHVSKTSRILSFQAWYVAGDWKSASLIAQLVENLPAIQETWFNSRVGKIWRKDRLPTPVFLGFPGGSAGKKSACNVGDLGLIPGLGRSSGEGKGYPLQYSGLENPMDSIVHGVAKSWTQLSDFHFYF